MRAVAEALCEAGARSALVADAERSVVGVVTGRALLAAVAGGAGPDDPVGPHASGPVPTAGPDATVREAADLMDAERLVTLPVTDADADDPLGVVTAADVAPFVSAGRTAAARGPRPTSDGDREDATDRGPRRPTGSTQDRRGSQDVAGGVPSGR